MGHTHILVLKDTVTSQGLSQSPGHLDELHSQAGFRKGQSCKLWMFGELKFPFYDGNHFSL